jgi:hypothetical protein
LRIYQNYIIQDNIIRPEIQFQKIALVIEAEEYVKEQDLKFQYESRLKMVIERKNTIRKEIQRTGINAKKINLENSSYYRVLIEMIKNFNDITLLDWFIPIVLDFKKFAYIYMSNMSKKPNLEKDNLK